MSLDERVAKLEQRMESWELVQAETRTCLREIRISLDQLHRHEVRITHCEKRDGETRELIREEARARHEEVNGVGNRISKIEPQAGLNAHGRELWEKWLQLAGAAIIGALATWFVKGFV